MGKDKKYPEDVLTSSPASAPTTMSNALSGSTSRKEKDSENVQGVPSSLSPPPSRTVPSALIVSGEEKNPDKFAPTTPPSVPAQAPTSPPKARPPIISSTQTTRTTYINSTPLANAGDFYRAIPGFLYSASDATPLSLPHSSLPSFPPSRHGYDAVAPMQRTTAGRALTGGLGTSRAAGGLPSMVNTVPVPTGNPRDGHGDVTTAETNSASSSSAAGLRSSVIRTTSLMPTSQINSSSIRSDSVPSPPEHDRSADPFGFPQDATSQLSSAIYTNPGGKGETAGAADNDDGKYRGRAEPMIPLHESSAPRMYTEIKEAFLPLEVEPPSPTSVSSVPAPHSAQPQNEGKARDMVRELPFCTDYFTSLKHKHIPLLFMAHRKNLQH